MVGNRAGAGTGVRGRCLSWGLAFLLALGGTGLSFWAGWSRLRTEEANAREAFEAESRLAQASVVRELRVFLDVLASIRQLHALSDEIRPAAFAEFLHKGLGFQREVLGDFGFVQRMTSSEREARENASPEIPLARLLVQEPDGVAGFRRASPRPVHYVLTFQTSGNGLELPLGFDFASDVTVRRAIEMMEASGGTMVAGGYAMAPILYPTLPGTPVPVPEPGFLLGFVVARLVPAMVLERARATGFARGLRVDLTDGRRPDAPVVAGLLQYAAELPVAGTTWRLFCSVEDVYARAYRSRQPEVTVAAGLLLTAFLCAEFLLLAGRARRTELLVRARTAELEQARMRLESAMEEHARLEHEVLDAGRRERLRLGQDLHDSLGQKLAGAVFLARTLSRHAPDPASEAAAHADQVAVLLKDAMAQVRRIAHGLAPVDLGAAGLVRALDRLAGYGAETYGIRCAVRAPDGEPNLPASAAQHLYHIAEEALNNAVRHGRAREVAIELAGAGPSVRLTIRDNGTGIGPDGGASAAGMGLRIMRHRAEMAGGRIRVEACPGGGTEVEFRT